MPARTTRTASDDLLLGEWACLGILAAGPAHGFAIAARLRPTADIGRVWAMSRALTYRALDQLEMRGLIAPCGEEPGLAGGTRRLLSLTPIGRARYDIWLHTPVAHLRDLRSELLLKLVLAGEQGVDLHTMLTEQRQLVAEAIDALQAALDGAPTDPVALWRLTTAQAAAEFLERLT